MRLFPLCKKRLPFNWKTPLGYVIALFMQVIGTYYTSAGGVPIACSVIGCCLLLKTFVEDITRDLAHFEANNTFHDFKSQSKILKHLKYLVKSFTMVKQLSFHTLRAFSRI